MSQPPRIQQIYTDGACSGNPGPGGWGVVAYFADGSVQELGGGAAATTNNRMEMQAAIAALQFLAESGQTEPVILYTDSEYLKNGITKWISGWKKKAWKTAQGKPVLNQDLWQLLDQLNTPRVEWRYVRGHAGNVGNERCDVIARGFAIGKPPTLKHAVPASSLSSATVLPASAGFDTDATNATDPTAVQSNCQSSDSLTSDLTAMDFSTPVTPEIENLPREVRVALLRNMMETLQIADEIATHGYLITSSELADLMDVNASAVTSRGDNWVWRNWVVSRVRREGNQILWQLERVD